MSKRLQYALEELQTFRIEHPTPGTKTHVDRAIHEIEQALLAAEKELSPDECLRFLFAFENPLLGRIVEGMVGRRGHLVTSVSDTRQVIEILETATFDIVLLDFSFPTPAAIQALEHLRKIDLIEQRHTPVIALTTLSPLEIAVDEWVSLLDAYICAPLEVDRFFQVIQRVLARNATRN